MTWTSSTARCIECGRYIEKNKMMWSSGTGRCIDRVFQYSFNDLPRGQYKCAKKQENRFVNDGTFIPHDWIGSDADWRKQKTHIWKMLDQKQEGKAMTGNQTGGLP